MAVVSSHLLNSTDGSHASGVLVKINQIKKNGTKKKFINLGRIKMEDLVRSFT